MLAEEAGFSSHNSRTITQYFIHPPNSFTATPRESYYKDNIMSSNVHLRLQVILKLLLKLSKYQKKLKKACSYSLHLRTTRYNINFIAQHCLTLPRTLMWAYCTYHYTCPSTPHYTHSSLPRTTSRIHTNLM